MLVCRNQERAAEDARQRDVIVQQLQGKIEQGGVRGRQPERGLVQAFVLAYALVRFIEDRLDDAGLDVSAKDALQDLGRIQRAPLYRACISVTKTSTPTKQQRLLAALGAPLPERHTAV